MIRVKKCETTGFEPGKSCPGFLYVTLHCWPCNALPPSLRSLEVLPKKLCEIFLPPPTPMTRRTWSWRMPFLPIVHQNHLLLPRGTVFMSETTNFQGSPLRCTLQSFVDLPAICTFGTNWDDCLHDRLVCGLSNTHFIKNCLWRRTSTLPKPFSWLQHRRQPLVMRWSLGRRLSLGRCTSLHLLHGDDQRRFCSLVHRHGLVHLQSRRSVSLVVTPVIVCNMVSAAKCYPMHVARRGTFLAPVHRGSRTGLQQRAFSHLSPSTTTVLAWKPDHSLTESTT